MAKTKYTTTQKQENVTPITPNIIETNNISTFRIEKKFGDSTYFMETKSPSILAYRQFVKMSNDSYYKAIDKFINNCIVNSSPEVGSNDNLIDDEIKVLFISDISQKYLTSKEVSIDINKCILKEYENEFKELQIKHSKIFTVYINDKCFFLRKPNRLEYADIFDKMLENTLYAFEYAYENLKIGGIDISEPIEFYSCTNVLEFIISSNMSNLKKK